MKGYAYLDKYGIMHVVASEVDAKASAKHGKVVEVSYAFGGGYPLANVKKDIHIRVEIDKKLAKIGKEDFSFDELKKKYPDVYDSVMKLI